MIRRVDLTIFVTGVNMCKSSGTVNNSLEALRVASTEPETLKCYRLAARSL